ncbi:JmjC domain-containing protein [Fusarium sp. LHS14.1]|nr:JmjC domain-containing protein [Fusarium sp. LHS14.1]
MDLSQTPGGAPDVEMVDETTTQSNNSIANTSGAGGITDDPLAIYHARIDKLEAEMTKRLKELKNENRQLTDKWMNELRAAEVDDEADTANDETGSVNDAQGQASVSRSPVVLGEQRLQKRRGSLISSSKLKVMIREFQGWQGSIDDLSQYFIGEVDSLRKTSAAPALGAPRPSSTGNSHLSPGGELPFNNKPPRRLPKHTRDLPVSQPQPAAPSESQKTFTLSLNEMGKNLTQNLQRLAHDEAYQVFKSRTRPIPASAPITYP